MTPERILCAAVHFDDGKKHQGQPSNIDSGFVIAGRRHSDVFATVVATGMFRRRWTSLWLKPSYGLALAASAKRNGHKQGFITCMNRFVDRVEAGHIAYLADQTKTLKSSLMSEDLY